MYIHIAYLNYESKRQKIPRVKGNKSPLTLADLAPGFFLCLNFSLPVNLWINLWFSLINGSIRKVSSWALALGLQLF